MAELARRQKGVLARRQLVALGVPRQTIDRWGREGRLVRIYRGVYALGAAPLTASGRLLAAALAYREGALLSHLSAAAHWNPLRTSAARVDVTVPKGSRQSARPGIRLHHADVHPHDRILKDSIPLTSPMRTLLDLAEVVSLARVREAFEQSQRIGLFDRRKLEAVAQRGHGRHGLKPLRVLLAEARDDPPDLRSKAEAALLDLIRETGLPEPQANVVVAGLTVDFYWPGHRLVAEVDGYSFHRSRDAFENDHARTERLLSAGLDVRRFTARRVLKERRAVKASLLDALGRAA